MNLTPFNFDSHQLRAAVRDSQLWLHASDVCAALDIANTSDALAAIPERHKSRFSLGLPGSAPWFVTKPGAYRLILRSRKPEAERFQDWLTDEVIPAIESTGSYGLPEAVRRYFDDLRARLNEADKVVEHKTRHDHFRLDGRSAENRQNTVAKVSAQYGLDPRLVSHANRTNATEAMAEIVGDPRAVEDSRRVRESLAAIERVRTPKVRRRR